MLDKNLWKQPNKRLKIYIKSIKPLKGSKIPQILYTWFIQIGRILIVWQVLNYEII